MRAALVTKTQKWNINKKIIILVCIPKQRVASYMQKQNMTTRFLCIFIASETKHIFVNKMLIWNINTALCAYKNMATVSQFRGRLLGELQFRV